MAGLEEFSLFQPPFIYFIILGFVIGIGFFLFRRFSSKAPTAKDFKGQTLNDILTIENFKPYLHTLGTKVSKGKLIFNMNTLPVRRSAKANFTFKEEQGKKIVSSSGEFILFETAKSKTSLPVLSWFLKNVNYFVVDDKPEYVTKDKLRNTWVINDNVFMYMLGGVWVSSVDAKEFVTEMIYKKIFENLKEEDVNYVKRVVHYNDVYASSMTSESLKYDLEKRKWEDRVYNETGVPKKGAS